MSRKRRSEASAAVATARKPRKETLLEQISSFVGFFVYLLVLKSFFLPLFIIPTGSMAQTLHGQHAVHTCANCGWEFVVGWQPWADWPERQPFHPFAVQCPNCRWQAFYDYGRGVALERLGVKPDERLPANLGSSPGDRIFVHGWAYDAPFRYLPGLGPQRWDVVVFKVPTDGQTNYIKRLIGKPNEKVELIDGDVFINDRLEPKSPNAQRSLWIPYYHHDYPPRAPSERARYHPRWIALDAESSWTQLGTRCLRFDGLDAPRQAIQFVTEPGPQPRPGVIHDLYGYNEPATPVRPPWGSGPPPKSPHFVKDVRFSAEVELVSGDGVVEFMIALDGNEFFACLYADGRLTLEYAETRAGPREQWAECRVDNTRRPVHLALLHLDGRVGVEVDGRQRLVSPSSYTITPDDARRHASRPQSSVLHIAAARVEATFRHVLIERDVYYISETQRDQMYGTDGNPINLGPEEYFVLGDNSPSSADSRYAFIARQGQHPVGWHLEAAAAEGRFHPGTVPADQLVGPAFFVYWPGFLPTTPARLPILPDLGRARWIR